MTRTAYVNGNIHTMNPCRDKASVLVVVDGRIEGVGSEGDLAAQIASADEVHNLGGMSVIPGIHDAHIHLAHGISSYEAELPVGADEDTIVDALRAWSGVRPTDGHGNEWIIGGRYWPSAMREPLRNDFLDSAFPDVPVLLHDLSAHNALVNTRALELARLDRSTARSNDGVVLDERGNLTGELQEGARWLAFSRMGAHGDEVFTNALLDTISWCHSFGVTSVQDASPTGQMLRVLRRLDESARLHMHIAAHLVWREEPFGMASHEGLEEMIHNHASFASPHIDARYVKIWLDGQPIEPYLTHARLLDDGTIDEDHLLVPYRDFLEAFTRFDREGLSVKVHTGGEGAVRATLDAAELARARNGSSGPRHEVAHCLLVDPSDVPRFKQWNVGAEMSPAVWHLPKYGVQHGYHFRTLLDAGADMTFGTDWSVSDSPNLFPAVQGALEHGRHSISMDEALTCLTINGARAVRAEATRGSLEPGKSADFAVLDRDLFVVPTGDVGATRVLRTIFEGRTVYEVP